MKKNAIIDFLRKEKNKRVHYEKKKKIKRSLLILTKEMQKKQSHKRNILAAGDSVLTEILRKVLSKKDNFLLTSFLVGTNKKII